MHVPARCQLILGQGQMLSKHLLILQDLHHGFHHIHSVKEDGDVEGIIFTSNQVLFLKQGELARPIDLQRICAELQENTHQLCVPLILRVVKRIGLAHSHDIGLINQILQSFLIFNALQKRKSMVVSPALEIAPVQVVLGNGMNEFILKRRHVGLLKGKYQLTGNKHLQIYTGKFETRSSLVLVTFPTFPTQCLLKHSLNAPTGRLGPTLAEQTTK
jgi:hypothetical protein